MCDIWNWSDLEPESSESYGSLYTQICSACMVGPAPQHGRVVLITTGAVHTVSTPILVQWGLITTAMACRCQCSCLEFKAVNAAVEYLKLSMQPT